MVNAHSWRLLIDLHILVTICWLLSASLYYLCYVHGPTLAFPYAIGKHLYLPNCEPSSDSIQDLYVTPNMTPEVAKEQTEKHGVAFVEQVLSPATASNLRQYILKANYEIQGTFIKENENRFHIIPDPMEPSIRIALKEIASHKVFRPLIDAVLGPSSSLVALSVITNLYEAEGQDWHHDTGMSYATHPDYFVPEYTLAIPLQDTTKEMGATGICPGTHKCNNLNMDYNVVKPMYEEAMRQYEEAQRRRELKAERGGEGDETDEEVSEDDNDDDEMEESEDEEDYDNEAPPTFEEWLNYNLPCNVTASVNAGDGMLYNADLTHKGGAHNDHTAAERVAIFITFAGTRQSPSDRRSLPMGTVHSLHWKRWGHTIDDFLTMEEQPWRIWHIFGLGLPTSPTKANSVRPWTMLDYFWIIFKHENECMHPLSNEFDLEYFTNEIVAQVFVWSAGIIGFYLIASPTLVALSMRRIKKEQEFGDTKIKNE
ncbi:unnamed protein product [Cylindrotheca closterium]|uniref:Uncharacterized protein n=1 Tax=Cylindrotheca closterium TaxID=2856 RepID=A0AAD2FWC3_9STRA|nr:unnamed protein product [Cylindrotheca closterium]